jgi:hypothetical protein
MSASPNDTDPAAPSRLRTAVVQRVSEQACEVWRDGAAVEVAFAPMFPTPRVERVSPGHRVAVATGPGGVEVVVWRWYDAVVLGRTDDGSVRLWEPAHGEVTARSRPSYRDVEPGKRAYASAGLPGADWWVVAETTTDRDSVELDLDAVAALYTDNDLWPAVFQQPVQ